jgi:hypothetical protein
MMIAIQMQTGRQPPDGFAADGDFKDDIRGE